MNAGYLYDIFEVTKKAKAPDLNTGLAVLQQSNPVRDPAELREIRAFLGRHYDKLVTAYQTGSKADFAVAVAQCEAEDAAAQEETNDC